MTLLPLLLLAAFVSLSLAWVPPIRRSPTRHLNRLTSILSAATTITNEDLLSAVREGIAEQEATVEWNKCVEFLSSDLDVGQEEAEILLASALDWKRWAQTTSPAVRKYTNPQLPNLQDLRIALSWLREGPLAALASDNAKLKEAIEKSPKIYLLDPATAYQQALESAPKEYQDVNTFLSLVLGDPAVLECNFNCYACTNECDNCWVYYELKRGRQ